MPSGRKPEQTPSERAVILERALSYRLGVPVAASIGACRHQIISFLVKKPASTFERQPPNKRAPTGSARSSGRSKPKMNHDCGGGRADTYNTPRGNPESSSKPLLRCPNLAK